MSPAFLKGRLGHERGAGRGGGEGRAGRPIGAGAARGRGLQTSNTDLEGLGPMLHPSLPPEQGLEGLALRQVGGARLVPHAAPPLASIVARHLAPAPTPAPCVSCVCARTARLFTPAPTPVAAAARVVVEQVEQLFAWHRRAARHARLHLGVRVAASLGGGRQINDLRLRRHRRATQVACKRLRHRPQPHRELCGAPLRGGEVVRDLLEVQPLADDALVAPAQ